MLGPEWTEDGKLVFAQKLTRYGDWGVRMQDIRYWNIDSDGNHKRPKRDSDKIVKKGEHDPIIRAEQSQYSGKHQKKIFLKDKQLWVLNSDKSNPIKLIQ